MKATISPKLLALVFASSLWLGICVQAAPPRDDNDEPTFTTIDFPGASSTVAFGINPSGDIVGRYESAGVTHGYLLSGNAYTSIDFPGASFTPADGINDGRDIVGRYTDKAGVFHAFLFSGGAFTSIDFPGSSRTDAFGINNGGDIVGQYCFSEGVPCVVGVGGVFHGFLLSGGEFTTIDFPGSSMSYANGINTGGDIIGGYDVGTVSHGFLLSGGQFTSIDFPDASFTEPLGSPLAAISWDFT